MSGRLRISGRLLILTQGLTLFTDGSKLESGATGYGVAWKAGDRWVGVKAHMGYNQ